MKVIYTAPNRAHHYQYALALHNAGALYKFVNGFSRWSPRAALPEIGNELVRVDTLQNIYLAGLKLKLPTFITGNLAYLAKIEQDYACAKYIDGCDIFLFYNGSGLHTCKKARQKGKISVVEAVNSHVNYQEALLKEEYETLKLPWQSNPKKEIERRVEEYDAADYIMIPSLFVKRSFLELGYPKEKLIHVPYGFNAFSAKGPANADSDQKDFVVLYVGTISVRKGLRYLLNAFSKFNHPKKKLLIVGPQAKPNGIEDVSIPDNVIFKGVLKGTELENAYKSATVFCLPSIEDGFGLVLGEALSFGVPIIATENTGASDIITHGEEGFIIPIRDSKSIFECFERLAGDAQLQKEMSNKAIAKVTKLKGWDETGHILYSSLLSILNNK